MNIKCAEDHLIPVEDQFGRAPLKNCIVQMIKNELGIDHFYISATRTILVRIDSNTINIKLFKDKV